LFRNMRRIAIYRDRTGLHWTRRLRDLRKYSSSPLMPLYAGVLMLKLFSMNLNIMKCTYAHNTVSLCTKSKSRRQTNTMSKKFLLQHRPLLPYSSIDKKMKRSNSRTFFTHSDPYKPKYSNCGHTCHKQTPCATARSEGLTYHNNETGKRRH
jgi:hypothetical protein